MIMQIHLHHCIKIYRLGDVERWNSTTSVRYSSVTLLSNFLLQNQVLLVGNVHESFLPTCGLRRIPNTEYLQF
jgi:hypothetical protein